MKKIVQFLATIIFGVAVSVGATTVPVIDQSSIVQCPPHSATSTAPAAAAYIANVYDTPSGNLDAGYMDASTSQMGSGTASDTPLTPAHVVGQQAYAECMDDYGQPIATFPMTAADYQQYIGYHNPTVKDSWKPRSTTVQPVITL